MAFPVEAKMRATAEAFDVKILAVYDICRSRLSNYQASKGEETDGKIGKMVNYMHLGAIPRATIDAKSELATVFTNHVEKMAAQNNGLLRIPNDLSHIGEGIQPTLPTVNDPYILKYDRSINI